MVTRLVFIAFLVMSAAAAPRAEENDPAVKFELGGRFQYQLLLDDQSDPYPWDASTLSASDRTRLMLDLGAMSDRYGQLYVKGAGYWGLVGNSDINKRFRFEQGDYLWARDLDTWDYGLRLFANERRFFVYDFTAPLIDDDRAGESGDNIGARFDLATRAGVGVTGVYSSFGNDPGDSRSAAYLKAAYSHRSATLSLSYLYDDPGAHGRLNHAVAKAELSGAWKIAFASVSYQQSGYGESSFFFPGGSFDWSAYDAGNFSNVLPRGGAAFGEFRVSRIPVTDAGRLGLVWKYEAVRDEFVSDLGMPGGSRVGQTAAAYFRATDVSINGRLIYHTSKREILETEERDFVEAGAWTALKNGMECVLRGGIGRIDEEPFETKKNYVHAAARYRIKEIHTGIHVMWSDLETTFSERRFAWDGKMVVTPDWGFHWRFLLTRDFAVGQSAFFRLEYRPSNRIFAYFGYGRAYFGDDPFVLEDKDLGLLRSGMSRWIVMLRGDF
jgi:hypothetical protein